ncbi:MAG: hypothetical protein ACAH80_17125 [Alphaproteobacteria bacterium]
MADDKEVKPDSPSLSQLETLANTGQGSQIFLAISEKFALDFLNAARRKLNHQPMSMLQMTQEMNTGGGGRVFGNVAGHLTDNFLAAAQRGAARIYTGPVATAEAEAPAQTGATTVAPKAPGGTTR